MTTNLSRLNVYSSRETMVVDKPMQTTVNSVKWRSNTGRATQFAATLLAPHSAVLHFLTHCELSLDFTEASCQKHSRENLDV